MSKLPLFRGQNMTTRLDKIDYYNNLPLSQLINEANCAEAILISEENVSEEKINDSKIIVEELSKRISQKI